MQGHVRQRKRRDGKPGSWQAIVSLGVDANGKRRFVSATAPTKREAMKERNRLLAEYGHQLSADPLPKAATVTDLFNEFMAIAPPDSKTSRHDYRAMFANHLAPMIGGLALTELRGRHLNAVYATMRDKGLRPSTIRKAHTVASAMCSFGTKNEWMATNPARNASPPKVHRTAVRATPAADISALLAAAESDPFGLFLRVSAALGTRRGETLGLQWGDIDFDAAQVTIARRVVLEPGEGMDIKDFTKTGGSRTIAIDPQTLDCLRSRMVEAQAVVALVEGTLRPASYVFSDDVGGFKPWHPSTASHKMLKLRRSLGLTDAHLHGLRHHVATSLLAAGVDVRTVAERLGNGAAVVLSTYSHFVPAADRAAAAILGEALNPAR